MDIFDPVFAIQHNTYKLEAFRKHDWLYSPEAERLRDEISDIAMRNSFGDDDLFDITFERDGWEERVYTRHPELTSS